MNRFLLLRFVLPLLLAGFAVGGVMVWQGGFLQVDSSARSVLQSDPRHQETYDKITSLLPETTFVMLALEMEDLFSDTGRDRIARASEVLLGVKGAVEVKSLTHSGRPVRRGMQLAIEPFFPRSATAEEWAGLRRFTTAFPLSRNVLVSADGEIAILVGLFDREVGDPASREAFRQEFMSAVEPFRSEVKALHVLAFPFVEAEGYRLLQQDLVRYGMVASVLVLAVLLVTFRSLPAVLLVLLLEALGAVGLLGLFRVWGQPVDVYTGILFPLIGGLQLTFITHYLSALQWLGREHPPRQAAGLALREVFRPSLTAALTTMAGLLTLAFADLPTVHAFGRIGAVAVLLVFVMTFLLPVCWGIRQGGEGGGPPVVPASSRRGVRYRLLILIGFILSGAVWLPGLPKVRTDIRAMEFIAPDHPIRRTLEVLNDRLGGTNIFQVAIDSGRPRGLQEEAVLHYLEDLRGYAMRLEGVSDAYAYSQLYVALNQIWEGGPAAQGTLPTSALKRNMFSGLLLNSPLLFKESFVDAEARESLLILRTRDMPGAEYLERLGAFMAYAEANKPEGVTLRPVQGLHTFLEGDRQIVENQVRTLGLSAGVILVLLGVVWRSAGQAGAVLLANVPALLTLFGIMGYQGLPLNSITVMVAAVLLGISVDDGIHVVSATRRLMRKGEPAPEAAWLAVRMKFKAIACTSAILAVFLGLLMLTSFPPVAHFGLLSACGLISAFLGAVFALPALLSWMR